MKALGCFCVHTYRYICAYIHTHICTYNTYISSAYVCQYCDMFCVTCFLWHVFPWEKKRKKTDLLIAQEILHHQPCIHKERRKRSQAVGGHKGVCACVCVCVCVCVCMCVCVCVCLCVCVHRHIRHVERGTEAERDD